MKTIRTFEQFINESKDRDYDVNALQSDVKQALSKYLSKEELDTIELNNATVLFGKEYEKKIVKALKAAKMHHTKPHNAYVDDKMMTRIGIDDYFI